MFGIANSLPWRNAATYTHRRTAHAASDAHHARLDAAAAAGTAEVAACAVIYVLVACQRSGTHLQLKVSAPLLS